MSVKDLKNSHKLAIMGGIVVIFIIVFWLLNRDTTNIPRANASFIAKKDSVDLSMYDKNANTNNDYKVSPSNLADTSGSTAQLAEVSDIPEFDYNQKKTKNSNRTAYSKQQTSQPKPAKVSATTNSDNNDDVTAQFQKRLKQGNSVSDEKKNNNVQKLFAVIYGDQNVKSNTRVKIRTTAPGRVGDYDIPVNTILYGNASFSGNRIRISINRLVLNGVEAAGFNANIYDATDGQNGIYVKGLDINASAKSTATEVTQGVVSQIGVIGRAVGNAISRNSNQEPEATLFNNTKIIIQ